MAIQGIVYERQEMNIADVEVVEGDNYKLVSVIKNGDSVITFPLPKTADTNEIAVRTGNIINQTGLVENSVRVDVTEIP